MYDALYTVAFRVILTDELSAVMVLQLFSTAPPRVFTLDVPEVPYTWFDFFLARTFTE